MSSSRRPTSGGDVSADLSVAKQMRDRRRRESRIVSTGTPDDLTAMGSTIGSIRSTLPPSGSSGTIPPSAASVRTQPPRTIAGSSMAASDITNRELLDRSQEISDQVSEAMRLAQRKGSSRRSTMTSRTAMPSTQPPPPQPMPPPQSLSSRQSLASTTSRRTTFHSLDPALAHVTTRTRHKAPAASLDTFTAEPPPTEAVTTNRSRRPQRVVAEEEDEEQDGKIVTLDAVLHTLVKRSPFARQLTLQHPLVITAGTRVFLRMLASDASSSPRILGVCGKESTQQPSLVEPCHVAHTADRAVEFVLGECAWPHLPALCFGNVVTLQIVDKNKNTPQYLQVKAASRSSTLTDASLWDVTVGPAPVDGAWHVWTVLPFLPNDDDDTHHDRDPRLPLQVGVKATQSRLPPCAVPVRHSYPVVLRHVKTGGLLSLSSSCDTLRIVTDALTSPGHVTPQAPAMDRLHRHHVMFPTLSQAVWLQAAHTPLTLPNWHFLPRMFLQGQYLAHPHRHGGSTEATDLNSLSPSQQAKALVDQLLGSMLGLESNLVRALPLNHNPHALVVDGCDASLCRLSSDLVQLSNDFVTVRAFVNDQYPGFPQGRVRQALGAALEAFLQDYTQHVSKIEKLYRKQEDKLGLQQLQVMVQSSCECLRVLVRTTEVAENFKGGELLNALQKLRHESYRGDAVGQDVLDRLVGEASLPYLRMLQQWLEDGTLDDPHEEFMVQASALVSEWEDCFLVREEHVLEGFFTTRQTLEQVLPTGRYWQAIQSCSSNHKKTKAKISFTLNYSTSPAQVAAFVRKQYLEASRELSRLLMVDLDLMGTLKLIKRYFLLDQGDFFVNFMDSAEADLYVARDKLSVGRLQHWLGLSVQLTEHRSDEAWVASSSRVPEELKPSANELRCHLAEYGLIDRLDHLHRETGGIDTSNPGTPQRRIYGGSDDSHQTGVDIFCIELPRMPSPLNLVLSPKNMNDYQLLFRSLFFAKHVERRLVSVWRDHLTMKELPTLRGSMGRTFLLRQRMLHCLQHLIYYMMFEVIEPNWTELEKQMTGASTVDDFLLVHSKFLEQTLEACLITSRELLSSLMRLMRTCLLFADQMKLFMKSIGIHQDRHNIALEKQKRVQQGLHDYDTSRRNNRKLLRETLRKDYLDRQRRVLEHTRRVEREVTVTTYTAMIDRHEEVFNQQLREFMNLLSKSDDLYHTQKVNLCISLDYNGFAESS